MRTLTCTPLFIAAALLCGCSNTGTTPGTAATPAGEPHTCMLKSGGINVLKLTPPDRAKCTAKDNFLKVHTPKYDVELWLVSGANTVDEAVGRASTQIADEFQKFQPHQTADLTIANAPAKRLVGKGFEADDGDPGEADLIVFKVGNHIFIACDHGEGLSAAGQQGLLALVQTAQLP